MREGECSLIPWLGLRLLVSLHVLDWEHHKCVSIFFSLSSWHRMARVGWCWAFSFPSSVRLWWVTLPWKQALLGRTSSSPFKLFFIFTCQKPKGFFLHIYWGHLVKVPEVNPLLWLGLSGAVTHSCLSTQTFQ